MIVLTDVSMVMLIATASAKLTLSVVLITTLWLVTPTITTTLRLLLQILMLSATTGAVTMKNTTVVATVWTNKSHPLVERLPLEITMDSPTNAAWEMSAVMKDLTTMKIPTLLSAAPMVQCSDHSHLICPASMTPLLKDVVEMTNITVLTWLTLANLYPIPIVVNQDSVGVPPQNNAK